MKFLVGIQKAFYDGHGEGEEADNEIIFITDRPIFKEFDGLTVYDETGCDIDLTDEEIRYNLENSTVDEDDLHDEDGYHCSAYTIRVSEITDEQAKEAQKVIDKFDIVVNEYTNLFVKYGGYESEDFDEDEEIEEEEIDEDDED